VAGPARVVIHGNRLTPHQYAFQGLNFYGIDASAVHALAWLTKDNPKRKKEIAMYKKMNIPIAPMPLYDFYLFDLKANWIIQSIQYLLIFIGKIRVWIGKPYDPWR
ncbi:MAG: hypothetical protein AAB276_09055, partial [Pseudomonadota bacterium]